MTALIQCDGDIADFLERYDVGDTRQDRFTKSWARTRWPGKQPQLALLATEAALDDKPQLEWLAVARPRTTTTTFDRTIEFSQLSRISPPIPFDELVTEMHSRHHSALERSGPLPSGGGHALVQAILARRPDLQSVIDDRLTQQRLGPRGASEELYALEKDATATLLEIAGLERLPLRDWRAPQEPAPFLRGIPERSPREDALITYEAAIVPGWVNLPTSDVVTRTFTNGRERLDVINANRTSIEETLGVDLLYYHENRRSFVLVQYKRMLRDDDGQWRYHGDRHIRAELNRMRQVDDDCLANADGEYRLVPTPCLVKLVKADHFSADVDSLLSGMYLTRAHFQQTLDDPALRGPRGGISLGFDNVHRRLTNSMFIDLLKGGWIGSTGSGTSLVAEQVQASLNGHRALILGLHHTVY
jgi:hypothetical protein